MTQYVRYNYMGREMWDWNIEEFCGYKPISTYYTDFGIAEWFGKDSVRDTYDRAVENWFEDIKWATEIVMVLNWKIWEHYHRGNEEWAKFYNDLWDEAQCKVFEMYENDQEAISYYYRTTD